MSHKYALINAFVYNRKKAMLQSFHIIKENEQIRQISQAS